MLAILSVLMGFASISTDLYLPAMPVSLPAVGAAASTAARTRPSKKITFLIHHTRRKL
jgi:DHA1 family bicyclomycin/chloramphenicol resistance-like MFS transporter